MRDVVCGQCNTIVQVPDDLAQASCSRCGQPVSAPETRVIASPSLVNCPNMELDPNPNISTSRPTEGYANWDDFRANSPAVHRQLLELATHLPQLHHMEYWPPPAKAFARIAELGDLLASLHKAGEYRRLHIAIGWGLIIAGGSLFSWYLLVVMWILDDVPDLADFGFIGFFALAAGVWYQFYRRPTFPVTFWIFENGILIERDDFLQARPWDEVHDFQVSMERGDPIFWLTVCWGVRVLISSDQGPGTVALMRFVETKITASRFLATLRQVYDGKRVHFDTVELGRAGLWGPTFFTPWLEVARLLTDTVSLIVEERGHLAWQQVRYRDISFPSLVLAIANVLMEESDRLPPAKDDSRA